MSKVRVRVAIFALVAITFVGNSAIAKEVPIAGHGKKQVKDSCQGAYWPTSGGGTYGCVNPDGSGIICGGVTAHDKKTCGTFREAPRRLPTRVEVRKAEVAEEKAQQKP